MRPCHNYFLSFHIQNKVFHFTPLTQYIIVSYGRRTPQGAAVLTRQARHRLKPCRGDTAACCRKATRRSQGSWSRDIRPRRRRRVG